MADWSENLFTGFLIISCVAIVGLIGDMVYTATRPRPHVRYIVESINRSPVDCSASVRRLSDDSLSIDHDACYLFERGQLFEVAYKGSRRVYYAVLSKH